MVDRLLCRILGHRLPAKAMPNWFCRCRCGQWFRSMAEEGMPGLWVKVEAAVD